MLTHLKMPIQCTLQKFNLMSGLVKWNRGRLGGLHQTAWTKSVAGLCWLQIEDRRWSSQAPRLHFNAATSHCSLKLDSSVCIQIDCPPALKPIQVFEQVTKSQSIVSWNGNGRKQVIGALNSYNGTPQAPGPFNGTLPSRLTYAGLVRHLFNV